MCVCVCVCARARECVNAGMRENGDGAIGKVGTGLLDSFVFLK